MELNKNKNSLIHRANSIKVKLITIIFIIGVILSLLLAFYSPFQSKLMGEQMMRKDAEFISNLLADNLSVALQARDFDGGATLKDILKKINDMNESEMITVSRVSIFDSELNFIDGLNVEGQSKYGVKKNKELLYINEDNSLKAFLPIIETLSGNAIGYTEIHFSKQFLNNESSRNTSTALLIALGALTVSVFFGFMLSIKIIKPINNLKSAIDKVTEERKLEFNLDLSSSKEINELTNSFKAMMQSIQDTQKEIFEKKAEEEKKKDEELINKIQENKNYLERNVEEVLEAMDKFTMGDLTVKLNVKKNDAIGRLFSGFNNTVSTIQEIIRNVRKQVEASVNAGAQISSITEQISGGAEDQKNQTEKVKEAIGLMTDSIIKAAKNAATAAESSNSARNSAKHGGTVVTETVAGMNKVASVVNDAADKVQELGNRSEEISEIILVIDEIASQTNLLALNAAIEAARAGEQGRGFAVVADEVKILADKTAKATKDISEMIKQIQNNTSIAVQSILKGTKEVDKWKTYTQKAGTSLDEIIIASERVSDLIHHVASAGEEQSTAVEQINYNIERISDVASKSVENIKFVAESSDNLNNITHNLQKLVSRFSIDDFQDDPVSYSFHSSE